MQDPSGPVLVAAATPSESCALTVPESILPVPGMTLPGMILPGSMDVPGDWSLSDYYDWEQQLTSQSEKTNLFPLEDKLREATLAVMRTGKLTPIIKEELKYTIQTKRMAMGKCELILEPEPPKKREQLSPEEVRKRDDRRTRNRVAAKKSRRKKKVLCDEQTLLLQRLEEKNSALLDQVAALSAERQQFYTLFGMDIPAP